MKKLICVLLAALIVASATAALADTKLAGTWVYSAFEVNGTVCPTTDPQAIVLTVRKDGTGIMTAAGKDVALTWALENDVLHFGKTDFRVQGTELLLVFKSCTLHFTKP